MANSNVTLPPPDISADLIQAEDLLTPPDPAQDLGVILLNQVFGPGWQHFYLESPTQEVNSGALPSSLINSARVSHSIVGEILGAMNTLALAMLVVLFVYVMAVGIMGTAHEGQPLGKRYSTLWTPIRSSLSVAMLIPIPGAGGFSILQGFLLLFIYFGIGAASNVTQVGMEFFKNHVGVLHHIPDQVKAQEVVIHSMQSAIARMVYERDQDPNYRLPSHDIPVYESVWERTDSASKDVDGSDEGFWDFSGSSFDTRIDPALANKSWSKVRLQHGRGQLPCPARKKEAGVCHIRYTVPRQLISKERATNDIFGSVKIECNNRNSPVCQARLQAWATLQDHAFRTAATLTGDITENNPLRIPRGYIDYAKRTYTNSLISVASTALDEVNSKRQSQMVKSVDRITELGWVSLGAMFLKISDLNETAAEELSELSRTLHRPPQIDRISPSLLDAKALVDAMATLTKALSETGLDPDAPLELYNVEVNGENVQIAEIGNNPIATFLDHWSPIRGLLYWYVESMSKGDMLSNLSTAGHTGLNIIIGTFGAYWAAKLLVKATPIGRVDTAVDALGKTFGGGDQDSTGLVGLAISTFVMAMVITFMALAFYIPFVPFFLWMFGVVGWFILVMEVMIAAPLWAIAHGIPEGEGMSGQHGRQGYMLFLRVLVRPTLMVVGFFIAIVGTNIFGAIVGSGFKLVMDTNSTFMGPFALVAYVIVLTVFNIVLIHKLFGLITWVPDNILNWLAQTPNTLGEQQSEREVHGAFVGAIGQMQAGGRGHGILPSSGKPSKSPTDKANRLAASSNSEMVHGTGSTSQMKAWSNDSPENGGSGSKGEDQTSGGSHSEKSGSSLSGGAGQGEQNAPGSNPTTHSQDESHDTGMTGQKEANDHGASGSSENKESSGSASTSSMTGQKEANDHGASGSSENKESSGSAATSSKGTDHSESRSEEGKASQKPSDDPKNSRFEDATDTQSSGEGSRQKDADPGQNRENLGAGSMETKQHKPNDNASDKE